MRRCLSAAVVVILVMAGIAYAGPSITLQDTMGVPMGYDQITGGERTIVFFWASWCHYCRNELEKLPQYQKLLADSKIKLISVNVGEALEDVKAYKDKTAFPYTIMLDQETDLARHFNIIGIPTFIYFSGGKEIARNNYFVPSKIDSIFKLNVPAASSEHKPETKKEKLRFK